MPPRDLLARVPCLAALFVGCALLALLPNAVTPRALAAALDGIPTTVECDVSRCADAGSAERYLADVSSRVDDLASRLASADRRNVAAVVAALNARTCAGRVGLLDGHKADTLPVAFSAVAASCEMAIVALRQAYRDAR